eukprot:c2677_g1_i1 orf=224-1282(+)
MAATGKATSHTSHEFPSPSYAVSLSHMQRRMYNLQLHSNHVSASCRGPLTWTRVSACAPLHMWYHSDVSHTRLHCLDGHPWSTQPRAGSAAPGLGQADIVRTELPHGLDADGLPRHVAVIMDGNARWAQAMGLVRSEGHKKGVQELMNIIWLSSEWGMSAFTDFLFSTENWNRSQDEVSSLMEIFERIFVEHLNNFSKYNIKVKAIGDIKKLPESFQNAILEVEEKTSQNTGLKVAFALNYGGRLDIIQAFQQVAAKVQQGQIKIEDISEQDIDNELWTSWMGDAQNPDLLIRTSGEQRISNFLLWQAAYSELLFVDTCFPAMNEPLYVKALMSYQNRRRQYGRREPLPIKA